MAWIAALPEIKQASENLARNYPQHRLSFMPKEAPITLNGQPYWEIWVGASSAERWERYETFYVPLSGGLILVSDLITGAEIPLWQWRQGQ